MIIITYFPKNVIATTLPCFFVELLLESYQKGY